MYEIPQNYYFRIHHIRPRFKDDHENVFLYMAGEISKLQPDKHKLFRKKLNEVIKLYPGNSSKKIKTINNWRTEISSLFGLIELENDISKPGKIALLLAKNEDLIEFFRYFLYYFQYPGGHLKPHATIEFLKARIRFKPAQYLLHVLVEGKKLAGKSSFGITKAEATHCIFNDLRVTRDGRSAKETLELILNNCAKKTQYDQGGDVTRYAGDILDYMVLADLVKLKPNYKYYLNAANIETIQAFLNDQNYFEPYESLYTKLDLSIVDIKKTQQEWFHYVNNKLYDSLFQANVLSIIEEAVGATDDKDKSLFIKEVLAKIRTDRAAEARVNTKAIGDVGEAITIEHERKRLTLLDKENFLHLIKKIPETFAVGYDISSFEGIADIRRYIEVKTTVSMGKLASKNFHMTPSEWSAANTLKKNYFIYRLMISTKDIGLFLIQDPVRKYKTDLLEMVPRNGADISYSEKSGYWEKLQA